MFSSSLVMSSHNTPLMVFFAFGPNLLCIFVIQKFFTLLHPLSHSARQLLASMYIVKEEFSHCSVEQWMKYTVVQPVPSRLRTTVRLFNLKEIFALNLPGQSASSSSERIPCKVIAHSPLFWDRRDGVLTRRGTPCEAYRPFKIVYTILGTAANGESSSREAPTIFIAISRPSALCTPSVQIIPKAVVYNERLLTMSQDRRWQLRAICYSGRPQVYLSTPPISPEHPSARRGGITIHLLTPSLSPCGRPPLSRGQDDRLFWWLDIVCRCSTRTRWAVADERGGSQGNRGDACSEYWPSSPTLYPSEPIFEHYVLDSIYPSQ
ncbi:hypothetical protein Hypma_002964 [Hypsizygus marmoreus]|uniref:Uncharacterized protein n=1 Tax=Hypsizygus marmoreus TaxID=39966 RepID=A0A369J7K4_HYPMA|nr:hypothetical protein Hypma_002964 [Hypsizygus marmoreus]